MGWWLERKPRTRFYDVIDIHVEPRYQQCCVDTAAAYSLAVAGLAACGPMALIIYAILALSDQNLARFFKMDVGRALSLSFTSLRRKPHVW